MVFKKSQKVEIVKSYENAMDYEDQVEILADLNACDKSDILRILEEAEYVKFGMLVHPLKGSSHIHLVKDDQPPEPVEEPEPKHKQKPRKKRIVWTPDKVKTLYLLKDEGKTYAEIGEHFGTSATSIQQALIRHSRPDNLTEFTEEELNSCENYIEKLHKRRQSILEIQSGVNAICRYLSEYLLSLGMKIEDGKLYPTESVTSQSFSQGYLLGSAVAELEAVKERVDSLVD